MGLRLFFWPNFPGATFIPGGMIIPDSRVVKCCYRWFGKMIWPNHISHKKVYFNEVVANALRDDIGIVNFGL